MKLRKLNRSVHRDLGYIFFFITIVYGLSGIALNHLDDWNPNYIIKYSEINIDQNLLNKDQLDKNSVISLIKEHIPGEKYKNHYFPDETTLKIFIKGGSINIDTETGAGNIETSKRRPVFHQFNYLHYNPRKWWTVISDIYAVSLMLLAITGLFAWLTALGIVVPIIFLLINYWKVF